MLHSTNLVFFLGQILSVNQHTEDEKKQSLTAGLVIASYCEVLTAYLRPAKIQLHSAERLFVLLVFPAAWQCLPSPVCLLPQERTLNLAAGREVQTSPVRTNHNFSHQWTVQMPRLKPKSKTHNVSAMMLPFTWSEIKFAFGSSTRSSLLYFKIASSHLYFE